MKYVLEINKPGSLDDVLLNVKSDTPFMALESGAIVDPAVWEDSGGLVAEGKTLVVVGQQHFITPTMHKVVLFTEAIINTRAEVRQHLGRRR